MIDFINTFDSFRELNLSDPSITDSSLKELKRLRNLEVLWLNGTSVSDNGIQSLSEIKSLREVQLNATHVTNAGVTKLQHSLLNCKVTH